MQAKLRAYALTSIVDVGKAKKNEPTGKLNGVAKPYAYLSKWSSTEDVAFLGYLLKHKVKVRFTKAPFAIESKDFMAGSLVITRRGNENLGTKFDEIIRTAAEKFNREISAVGTGLVTKGKDFGSNKVSYLKAPKVALLSGSGVSSLGFGEIWHLFEQQIQYPVTVLDTEYFNSVNLNKYDVLILPSGFYNKLLGKEKMASLKEWVQQGGRLIAIDRALGVFANSKDFNLSIYKDEDEKKEKEKVEKGLKEQLELEAFDNLERISVSNLIIGSVFNVSLDNTHPLGFGYGKKYHTLRLNSNRYAYLKDGINVSVIKNKSDLVSGFSGSNALKNVERSLVFGVEQKGSGELVYLADNPLFRSFWENGKLIFCNAVFMVGQ